ncbi:MAG: YbbR-like domain-containing protein [Nitrospiraceae bacterium]|nr:MAG: YbbR-like domain-containing protein [Nitrospiraceae bacterium]
MIKDFFTTNIWLKLASLLLAIALWFFVILSGRSGVDIEIPITFMNLSPELEMVDSPQTVSVSVEGQERLLKKIRSKEIQAVVDLVNAKAGRSFFSLSEENIKLPRTLELISINPEIISLTIEKQMRKTVSVKPSIVGLPLEGHAIVEMKVVPDTVIIEGPRSVISKLYTLKTEPIDITGINSDLRYKAGLSMPNSNLKSNTQKVDIYISVQKIR